MMRKIFIITILVIFAFTLSGKIPKDNDGQGPPPKKVGYILLDSIITGFNTIAVSGKGGYNEVNNLLQKSMAMLKKANNENKVDTVFYHRYKRILEILKLTIMDFRDDSQGILNTLIGREMQNFVYDITGETKDLAKPKSRGLGSIAKALVYELLNLHIYLDTIDNRMDLVMKYFKSLPPPAKKKKDK